VTNLRGPGAVVSGIFLDGTPGNQIVYVGQDTASKGSWAGKYGSSGAYVVGSSNSTPNFVGPVLGAGVAPMSGPDLLFSLGNGGVFQGIAASTHNKIALQKPGNFADRGVSYFAGTDFNLDLNLNDNITHRVTLYMVDYDKKGRSQTIQFIDPATGRVLQQRSVSNFKNGIYVSYDITGPVTIRFIRTGGPNAVLSGVFFD
jgi:hypothetical protein